MFLLNVKKLILNAFNIEFVIKMTRKRSKIKKVNFKKLLIEKMDLNISTLYKIRNLLS